MPVSGAGVGPGVDAEAGVAGRGGSGGESPGAERAAAGVGEGGVMRGHSGVLSATLAIAALLGSLSLTVWRQGRALELLRALDELRSERAVVEAERTELMRRIGYLESRGRVVSAARARLGMRVPTAGELVILPLDAGAAPGGEVAW